MPFDCDLFVAEWRAFALEACRVRALDAQKRQAGRDSLEDNPAAALCQLLATRMPGWCRENTRLADVSDFLEGVPAQFDNQGNEVLAPRPGCEDGVGYRSRRAFAREWGRYQCQVRACLFELPQFGFAAHEPHGVMCPTDYTQQVFANANIGNVVDNPLWNACGSASVQRPQFICALQTAVWRYVERKPTPIQAIHDRHESDREDVAAKLVGTRTLVLDAMAELISKHRVLTDHWDADVRWLEQVREQTKTKLTRQEAEALQVVLAATAADTHHDGWFQSSADAYREQMVAFVRAALAVVPGDDVDTSDEFRRSWSQLVSAADARTDASAVARATGTMNETPPQVAERRIHMQQWYIRQCATLCHSFLDDVHGRAMRTIDLRAAPDLESGVREEHRVVCEVLQQLEEVSDSDRSLLLHIQGELKDAESARFEARRGALCAESLARDQRAILRMGADLHAEQVARNQPDARRRLRAQLSRWLGSYSAPGWTLPPDHGLHLLLATDQRLVAESQLDKTLLVQQHRDDDGPTTFSSLVGTYTTALDKMLDPACMALRAAINRQRPRAQAQPVWMVKQAIDVYADWFVDDDTWQAYKQRLVRSAAGIDTADAALQQLLAAERLPLFETVIASMLAVLRHAMVRPVGEPHT